MKKTIAILALALFIGGISVPVLANTYETQTLISLQDDDPKKKTEKKKAEKSKEATKSGDCAQEKKSDCSSKCGGEK